MYDREARRGKAHEQARHGQSTLARAGDGARELLPLVGRPRHAENSDPEHLPRDGRADIYNVVVEMEGQIYIM